jgi:hypothetical protein
MRPCENKTRRRHHCTGAALRAIAGDVDKAHIRCHRDDFTMRQIDSSATPTPESTANSTADWGNHLDGPFEGGSPMHHARLWQLAMA